MGCLSSKTKRPPGYEDPVLLASQTSFTANEVEALYELFKKMSFSIIKDGLIHKEEFQLALFRNTRKKNLFADRKKEVTKFKTPNTILPLPDQRTSTTLSNGTSASISSTDALVPLDRVVLLDRIFEIFDAKRKGAIEFGDFVRALSIFHPNTSKYEKAAFAFQLYDLRHTGSIERVELKEMVLALLSESDLDLSEEIVEAIVDNTFKQADSNGDGKIDEEEW